MELVPALPARGHEAGGLEHVEVLRHRLPRRAEPVLHREARAELEQRLPVTLGELVEQGPSRGIGQGLEDVTHASTIGKCLLACQAEAGASRRNSSAPARTSCSPTGLVPGTTDTGGRASRAALMSATTQRGSHDSTPVRSIVMGARGAAAVARSMAAHSAGALACSTSPLSR